MSLTAPARSRALPGLLPVVAGVPVLVADPAGGVVLDPADATPVHDPGDASALADRVEGALAAVPPTARTGGAALAAGALPFRHGRIAPDVDAVDGPARLLVGSGRLVRDVDEVLASLPCRGAADASGPAERLDAGTSASWRRTDRVGAKEHARRVRAVVDRIEAGELTKAVLARAVELVCGDAVDVPSLLHRLAARDPAATLFAVPLADGGLLCGATPELLVSRRGGVVEARPLAGSLARVADPAADRERAVALAGSAKDRREHAILVDDVVERLRPWCRSIEVEGPSVVATARMWHLGSRIRATPRDDVGALRLALALHPTPAVGGTPLDAAAALVGDLEQRGRGYYAGAVGWQDAAGDGAWSVAIRCARLDATGRRALVHAGGGIVAGSDPLAEHAETEAKLRTVLDALEVG